MDLTKFELTQPYQTLELDLSSDWKPTQGKILSWKVARLRELASLADNTQSQKTRLVQLARLV